MIKRLLAHFFTSPRKVKKLFGQNGAEEIEKAIKRSESMHQGELSVVVESRLSLGRLMKNMLARERALELFAQHRIWDTEKNIGVLIYVLIADHKIEIIADRGVNKALGQDFWNKVSSTIEANFKQKLFTEGCVAGVNMISSALAEQFPASSDNLDEISNKPKFV